MARDRHHQNQSRHRPDPRHVLVAPDKFRGSLTATAAAAAIAAGVRCVRPDARVTALPIADGGEGSLEVCRVAGFRLVEAPAADPMGEPITARYARLGDTAVIELAQASGLAIRGPSAIIARYGSTYGTGTLVRHALDRGARTIVLAVGGSATTDAGTGLAAALGARFPDSRGRPVPPGGDGLTRIAAADLSGIDHRLKDTKLVVATDVDVPLTGPRGAARLFAAQKGATASDILDLEEGLARFGSVVRRATGIDPGKFPGAGASGGVPAAALLMGAVIRKGAAYFLDLLGFDEQLRAADLVITGEGHVDRQTLAGKGPAEVAHRAAAAGRPVLLAAGRISINRDEADSLGVTAMRAIEHIEADPDRQNEQAAQLLCHVTVLALRHHIQEGQACAPR